MKYLALILALALAACDGKHSSETTAYASDPGEVVITDQCLRRELFNECMKALPAGPVATKYNDWDEVVSQCGREAYYMAKRKRAIVKPECEGS